MQLFCAAVCFLFTSGSPLQASKLTFGSDSDACYAAFLRSLTETFRGLNSCICALTRNFLKAAVLHHFLSGVWLEQLHLRLDELWRRGAAVQHLLRVGRGWGEKGAERRVVRGKKHIFGTLFVYWTAIKIFIR